MTRRSHEQRCWAGGGAVLDETKEFLDDGNDSLRADRDPGWEGEVAALRELVAGLTATVDGLGPAGGTSPPRSH
jgi:hypothetical protein